MLTSAMAKNGVREDGECGVAGWGLPFYRGWLGKGTRQGGICAETQRKWRNKPCGSLGEELSRQGQQQGMVPELGDYLACSKNSKKAAYLEWSE